MSENGEQRPELTRTFGWWDMFVEPADDPRADGGFENNERAMLVGYLADRRLTLRMKCAGLDADGMARRSASRGTYGTWSRTTSRLPTPTRTMYWLVRR
ncbi:hypothetical protein [Fodinicola feengrottensis]|uniref:Uncharacterized protein n=1 Tax=Fodinicola feengrottensis TaxID=435914 RepID=A0ABN2FX59_9ACTN|nr:hypothetical protein [Fodinicola feengrottensis]